MPLSLTQTQALNKLADRLYSFLPGKAHPFADQRISFENIATSLGLGRFWAGGSKLPAISSLLGETLEHQAASFCPLLLEIVRRGMGYRRSKGSPIGREEMDELIGLIAEVGFRIPELNDSRFLGSLPRQVRSRDNSGSVAVTDKAFEESDRKLLALTSLSPQDRGFAFEKFLKGLFETFGFCPRGSFRMVGEQIDGSLQFQGETYLVEATWQNERVGEARLLSFSGKTGGRSEWARGLFISYTGFTQEGLEAFAKGKRTNIVCMDGLDLHDFLGARLSLVAVLERKVRRAAETNEAFVPVRALFPEIRFQ